MTTVRLNLSNNAIEVNQLDTAVNQLRDNRHSVYYRYNKHHRELGTFYGVTHQQGKTKWIKLGCYPALSAKNSLIKMQKLLQEGALKETVTDQLEFITVKELLTWYQARLRSNKSISQHTKQNQSSCIKRHLLPLMGEIEINTLSLSLVDEKLFQPLQSKLSLSTVDNVLSVFNAARKRARQVELINDSAMFKCTLAEFTNQRPRYKATRLTKKALLSAIRALPKQTLEHQILFVLLLMHGTRIGETVNAKWETFDFKEKLWRIPAEDTKTKKAHSIPLTKQAIIWLRLYRKYQLRQGKSAYLFHQKNNRSKAKSPNHASTVISTMANKQWSAHDLRKFARSCWMDLGIDYMVAEFLLNHTLKKLDQTYIQTLALPNCRAALDKWCNWLEQQGLTPRYKLDSPKR
ncbi:MAG: site-specific integrase [Colwellia sp.]|uniref:tyrosine-type recombinase/integrase n=1 Tax=Alteromonadales TaxID=135622 RepID=UPI001D7EC990|nr:MULTISPECIES: site-specific integrase [Alteromonadales]NQZ27434.1 site-specific integrase [Colwellia sp.]NRA80337.1 site-specific integrase [Pseudoalteromonas sp.]